MKPRFNPTVREIGTNGSVSGKKEEMRERRICCLLRVAIILFFFSDKGQTPKPRGAHTGGNGHVLVTARRHLRD